MRRFLTTLSIASLALTAACGSSGGAADSDAAHQNDGTIVYAFSVSPTTLDPAATKSAQELLYLRPVYDRLVHLDPLDAKPSPMLATEWALGADDVGSYAEFKLREGLTFPDGKPFNSDAVVANLNHYKSLAGSGTAADLAPMTQAVATDPYTVRVYSEGGAAWVPNTLGGRAGMMISPAALGSPDLATNPVGIAPWTLESFDPAKVTYVKTENYWDPDVQKADKLEVQYIPDDVARFNAARSGGLDFTFIRGSQVDSAKADGLTLLENPGSTVTGFYLNPTVPGLDDPEVRQALSMAINREAIANAVWNGYCTPTDQIWSPGLPWHNPDHAMIEPQPDKAKKTIEESDLGPLTMVVQDSDIYKRLGEVVQAELEKVGVQVSIQIVPASALRSAYAIEKSAQLGMAAIGLEGDPSQLVANYLLPGGLYNLSGEVDTQIAALAEQGLSESDDERASTYQEIAALETEQTGFLAVCAPNFLWVSNGKIGGFDGALSASQPEFRGMEG